MLKPLLIVTTPQRIITWLICIESYNIFQLIVLISSQLNCFGSVSALSSTWQAGAPYTSPAQHETADRRR